MATGRVFCEATMISARRVAAAATGSEPPNLNSCVIQTCAHTVGACGGTA